MKTKEKNFLEDDAFHTLGHILKHRLPWLILGLFGGIFTSFIVSNYEKILSSDLRLAFFIPIIVYMGDAVGTQTETIYVRHLKKTGVGFLKYILKETFLGLSLGLIFGITIGLVALYWLQSSKIALTLGLAMFINITIAPILATIIPAILYKEHSDPALGAGPLATILQDLISLLVYFIIASIIIL